MDSRLLRLKLAKTPTGPSLRHYQDASAPFLNLAAYRQLVGWLLYLTTTWPNVCFITQQLSQFMSNPIETHHHTATRLLHYLKGSLGQGLHFQHDANP